MKFKILLILIFAASLELLYSQEEEPEQTGNSSKPLELPNFIIEGKEQLNVKAGSKQYPERPTPLSPNELDSLNSLEKQQSLLLHPDPLPNKVMNSEYRRGYIDAGFGRHAFANFEIGYGIEHKEYSFFGNAGFDYSNAHVTNSEFNKFHVDLKTDYIAPSKFFIFGGSKTRSYLKFDNANYKLYAMDNPPERNNMNFDMGIQSEGSYAGYVFSTGANFRSLQMSDDYLDSINPKLANNQLNGFLSIKNMGHDYEIGIKSNVALESIHADGVHFIQAAAFGSYSFGKVTVDLNAGFQAGGTSSGVERGGLLIDAGLDYKINSLLTFNAGLFTGLKKIELNHIVKYNPYINRRIDLDFSYDMPLLKAYIYYHPNQDFGANAGIRFGSRDRTLVFDSTITGMVRSDYQQVNHLSLESEAYWKISRIDKLSSYLLINYESLSENGNIAPYTPLLKFSADYSRLWFNDIFGTKFGLVYVGKRFADYENKSELGGFIDIMMQAEYKVFDDMKVSLSLQNLLNSDIVVWQGYKERGIYFGLGLNYIF